MIKNKIDEYFKLEKEIHEYFGYEEGWCVFPIEDSRDYYWFVTDDEVIFYNEPFTVDHLKDGAYYSNEIYTYRCLDKFVFRKDDCTMICVDTNTDGNKFLQIFDNAKEFKDQTIIKSYGEL